MPASPAFTRLSGGHYNTGDWNAATNPGGMGGDGHRQALVPPKPPQTGSYPTLVDDVAAIATDMANTLTSATSQVALAAAEADRARTQADRAASLTGTAIAGSLAQSLTLPLTAGAVVSLTGLSTGKAWVPGHLVEFLPNSAPLSGQRIQGTLTAYNPTTGAASLTVKRSWGTGTVTQWSVRCVAPSPFVTGHVNRSLADLSADGTHVRADGRAVEKADAPALYEVIGDRFAGLPAAISYGPQLGHTITTLISGNQLFYYGGNYYLFSGNTVWRGTTLGGLSPIGRFLKTIADVAHNGAGLFVVVLEDNQMGWVDGNGVTESTLSPYPWVTTGTVRRIFWSPVQSRFYAFPSVANDGFLKSNDGRTWTTVPAPAGFSDPYQIAYHAGRAVMVQANGIYLASPDGGETWTVHSDLPQTVYSVAAKGDDATGNSWLLGGNQGLVSVSNQFTGTRTLTALTASNNNNHVPHNALTWDSLANRFIFVAANDESKICLSGSFPVTSGMTIVSRAPNTYGYGRGRLLIVNGQRLDFTSNMLCTLDTNYSATVAFVGFGSTNLVTTAAGKLFLFQNGWTVRISSDKGETWTIRRAPVGFNEYATCQRGAVSADGQKIVMMGPGWNSTSNIDSNCIVWSSIDGGVNWTRSVLGSNGTYQATLGTLRYDNGYFHVHNSGGAGDHNRLFWIAEATPSGTWSTAVLPAASMAGLTWLAGKWLLLSGYNGQFYTSTAATPTGFTVQSHLTDGALVNNGDHVFTSGNRLFVRYSIGSVTIYRAIDMATLTSTLLWSTNGSNSGLQYWRAALVVGNSLLAHADCNLPGLTRCIARFDLSSLALIEILPAQAGNTLVEGLLTIGGVQLDNSWYSYVSDRIRRTTGPTPTQFQVPNLDAQLGSFPAHYIAL